MREVVHLSEKDVESWKLIESLLKYVKSMLEICLFNEREANIDMRLPPLKGRIVYFPQSLDLFIVLLNSKCESSVIDKFGCRFHNNYKRFLSN